MKLQYKKKFNMIMFFRNKFRRYWYDSFMIHDAILGDIGMITLPMMQSWPVLLSSFLGIAPAQISWPGSVLPLVPDYLCLLDSSRLKLCKTSIQLICFYNCKFKCIENSFLQYWNFIFITNRVVHKLHTFFYLKKTSNYMFFFKLKIKINSWNRVKT